MKKWILSLFLIGSVFILMAVFSPMDAMAIFGPGTADEDHRTMVPIATDTYNVGTSERKWNDIRLSGNLYIDDVYISAFNKAIPLPIFSGMVTDSDDTTVTALSTTSTPGLEIDNTAESIVWADNETSYVQVTFRVPADYVTGGCFRVVTDESDSTTPNQIDFNVFVNTNGTLWDTSATNQTPVALAGDGAGTPTVVTLTPATDFASLVAGQIVTLNMWRDNTANGTGDLEIYYVEFYYQ